MKLPGHRFMRTLQSQARALRGIRVIGKSAHPRRLQNLWNIIRSVFREIFDESAYDRFLVRTKGQHSADTYRAFQDEREGLIAHKPRCC